jgi:2,4-dienoyl-CoA reductase-like NADH-dependent reductase (Old Yellow Enzyme family)
MNHLSTPLRLKSGIQFKNRLAKSALSEQLSDRYHNPTEGLIRLYQQWAQGGAGLLITGNVMLAPEMIGEPKNIVLNEHSPLDVFKAWADAAQSNGCKCFMQLNHPGRQVPNILALTPKAPSAVAMRGSMRLAFNKPIALLDHEIWDIIRRFATSAKLAKACGFAGVQIHGAHGYLVNQFLSPLQNRRTDQ